MTDQYSSLCFGDSTHPLQACWQMKHLSKSSSNMVAVQERRCDGGFRADLRKPISKRAWIQSSEVFFSGR